MKKDDPRIEDLQAEGAVQRSFRAKNTAELEEAAARDHDTRGQGA